MAPVASSRRHADSASSPDSDSAGDTVPQVVVEQLEGDALQGTRRRADLGEHIDAVGVVLDHPLQATNLALDAAEALEVHVLVGGVATFEHGWEYTPSG